MESKAQRANGHEVIDGMSIAISFLYVNPHAFY